MGTFFLRASARPTTFQSPWPKREPFMCKYPPACFPWSVPLGTADMILIRWNVNCRILRNVILNRSPGEGPRSIRYRKGFYPSLSSIGSFLLISHAAMAVIRYGTLSRSMRLMMRRSFLAMAMVARFPPLRFFSLRYFSRIAGSFVMSIQVLSTR
jgi:hypothetical protein